MDVQLVLAGTGAVLMAVGAIRGGSRRLRGREREATPETRRVEQVRRMQEERQARRAWRRRRHGHWRVH